MSILASILATIALGSTPIALSTLAPPDEVVEIEIDPAFVQACVAAGEAEADCIAKAEAAAIAAADPDAKAAEPADAEAKEGEPAPADAKEGAAIEAEAQEADAKEGEPEPALPAAAAAPEAAVAIDENGEVVLGPDGEPIVAPAADEIDPNVAQFAGADGQLSAEEADAMIAAGAGPQGETMEEAHPGMSAQDYLALLRDILRSQREKVALRLEEKIAAKQDAKMATMSTVLGWVSLGGLLLLFLPLALRKKYPGQDALLFKYSALAAGVCVVVVFLFSRVLLLLRGIQGALSSIANPQVAVIDASFQVLDDNVEDLVEVGPVLIEAPLAQVASGEEDSLPLAIIQNIQRINEDITIFKTIARQFEGVFAMFGYLPIVLTVVAVVLFVLSIKPVIMEIVSLPGRVASGQANAKEVVKQVFRAVGRELLATLCLIGVLIFTTILSGIFLSMAVEPAIEAFLAYVFTSLLYTMAAPEFSKFVVYMSVMGALLFLVLNIAVVLVTNVLFLGKVQKIFKRRFHDKVALGLHKRFWLWGTLALVWAQLLPLLFVAIAQEGVGKLIDALTSGDGDPPWSAILLSGPAILVLGFIVVFWAARGLAGIGFIMKYKPQEIGAPVTGHRGGTARYRSTLAQ